ncbi:glycoside hydrolase family 2 protein [Belliella marina]|uniref:Glycoside hydrolase family 2 protein n=1 Tax=Belliella marina TaxID=1644146 RepID=A0ABW4VMI4_9BACT
MSKYKKTAKKKWILAVLSLIAILSHTYGQTAMINVESRDNKMSLNGEWKTMIDPANSGEYLQVWQEKTPQKKTDFFEYSFEGAPLLKVPGDFNSQLRELTHLEGIAWYKKSFNYSRKSGKRLFLHFGAVNYLANVYLNGEKIGSHEGGFTPFQFEITDIVKEGENALIVKVDNRRHGNGLPGFSFDWLNFGGITRDVDLIETNDTYIEDYTIQLKKGSLNTVQGSIQLNGTKPSQKVKVRIPELDLIHKAKTDEDGIANIEFTSKFELWSPENPKIYEVIIESETDIVKDQIGFRSIEVKGTDILLNGQPIFIKAVNIHEENPHQGSRAHSVEDAQVLLNAAKELGCNLVRLAHYPHSENTVREAEKMGLMVWSELPIYQHIQFEDSLVPQKMENMLKEMIRRDKNRCGVVVWALSNETYPGTPGRNDALIELTQQCRAEDSTRLVVHVANTQTYKDNTFGVSDSLYLHSDIVAVNEYIGWYIPWQGKPSETQWHVAFPNKPLFISEFGGEAMYGSQGGPEDEAAYWTEGYQEKIYVDQVEMFNKVPNLVGVCPWLLFDYKSPGRMHTVYQQGYNRKGLLSEKGDKKKAWYVMKEYFKSK